MPRFSVIVPTRNRRQLLERALASVAAQTEPAGEVIVVDDESTDDTSEYLAKVGARVRSVRLQAGSPGAARNAGAALATGEYLVFLDSDDVWMPWALETFSRAIVTYDRPALVAASFRQFDDEGELARERPGEFEAGVYRDYLSSWPRQKIVGAGMMAVRRDVFTSANGFRGDPINLEDHDFMLRIGTAPGFVVVRTPLVLGWRRHSHSVTRDLARSVAGCGTLMAAESGGQYPGGPERAAERRGIVTMHARSVSIECARAGLVADARRIYLATLGWHLSLRRWKYLATFPLVIAVAALRPRRLASAAC